MRYSLLLLFLIAASSLHGQSDTASVIMMSDDASPFTGYITHMYAGRKNLVHIEAPDFIKAWTGNGRIDSGDYYLTETCIIPEKPGPVNVFVMYLRQSGEQYDTAISQARFTALVPPQIYIEITKDRFRKDSTLSFVLRNKRTSKPAGKRYQAGHMYEPDLYDEKDSVLGKIHLCFGNTISFASEMKHGLKVASGYKIKIAFWVRDMETDLMVPVQPLVYVLK